MADNYHHKIGTAADTAAAGTHASQHNAGGADALTIDAAAATGSLRTLGTGAAQAAAGDHSHSATGAVAIVKAGDETVNNSSTLQNDDDFVFALAANEKWVARLFLLVSGVISAGIKIAWSLPSGATYTITGIASATGVINESSGTGTITFTGTSFTSIVIDVAIHNGSTPGNAQLQWAQNAAILTDTKVLADSTMVATKV